MLEKTGHLRSSQLVEAREATHEMLLDVHDEAYLKKISSSSVKVATVRDWLRAGREGGANLNNRRQGLQQQCLGCVA